MTPPPMTTMLLGSFSRLSAPVESMQLGFSFRPGMGGWALTEPVATMMASAVISSTEPSDFFTERVLGPVKLASPSIFTTLLAFSSPATPLVSCLETAFLWAITWGKFTRTPSVSTPISAPWSLIWDTSSALCSRHLVGMQPMFRQVPPRCSRSTRVTLAPSWAARMAAT